MNLAIARGNFIPVFMRQPLVPVVTYAVFDDFNMKSVFVNGLMVGHVERKARGYSLTIWRDDEAPLIQERSFKALSAVKAAVASFFGSEP